MQSFLALSSRGLLETLGKISIPLKPPPRKDRKKDHKYTEIWAIRCFLEVVAQSGLLDYPLCVEHRERPDIVLSSRIGKTGIEITEAVPEAEARADALLEHRESSTKTVLEDMPGMRFVPANRYGEKRTRKEIEDIARNRDPTQLRPSMGDSWERNWVEAMVCITKHKAGKFATPGFVSYDRNWLLIYDNWSPAPTGGCQMVAKLLAQQLFNCEWRNPFEKIFILKGDGQTVWEFSRDAEVMKLHGPGQNSCVVFALSEME